MSTAKNRSLLPRFLSLALLLLGLISSGYCQQVWPNKPIRMLVGYPSGSSPDVQARLLAEPLGKALGQPVVVENRPGASGNIGAELLSKADDNHTIGVVGNGPLTSSKFLYPRLGYDPLKDLAPIALIGTAPLVWVVPSSISGTSAQILAQIKDSRDSMAYGSIGAGSGGHLAMELLKEVLDIRPLHVPFNGGPPILNAMMGGQIQMTLLPASTVAPFIQSGKLNAVAVTSSQRSPLAPLIPSMSEIGVKNVNIEVWNAVMAPSRMSVPHQNRLRDELAKILSSREMRLKLVLQGWRVDDSSAGALAKRLLADTALYRGVIERKGIKLE